MQTHPYQGLRDKKGCLKRLTPSLCTISVSWIKKYIELGGTLDEQGVHGISPNQNDYEKYSPEFIFKLFKQSKYRWDRVPSLSLLNNYGISIDESVNLKHLIAYEKALPFIAECFNDFGFHPILNLNKSPIFCYKMSKLENLDKKIRFQLKYKKS